jgi:hypothetical protein
MVSASARSIGHAPPQQRIASLAVSPHRQDLVIRRA